jgi:phosphatidylglycerophosphate synthase
VAQTAGLLQGSGPGSSRAATEELLGGLSRGGWRARSWMGFVATASTRSARQARGHPLALMEVSVLHLLFAALGRRGGRAWVATSWALAAIHLGMLEQKQRLGWANLISLTRANLPAVGPRLGSWLPVLAIVSDVADGAIARRTSTATPFGRHADFLADTALWTWFVLHHERSRAVKAATLTAWGVPVVLVAAASFARGGMVDVPRSRWLRPCAALQVLICLRAVIRPAGR